MGENPLAANDYLPKESDLYAVSESIISKVGGCAKSEIPNYFGHIPAEEMDVIIQNLIKNGKIEYVDGKYIGKHCNIYEQADLIYDLINDSEDGMTIEALKTESRLSDTELSLVFTELEDDFDCDGNIISKTKKFATEYIITEKHLDDHFDYVLEELETDELLELASENEEELVEDENDEISDIDNSEIVIDEDNENINHYEVVSDEDNEDYNFTLLPESPNSRSDEVKDEELDSAEEEDDEGKNVKNKKENNPFRNKIKNLIDFKKTTDPENKIESLRQNIEEITNFKLPDVSVETIYAENKQEIKEKAEEATEEEYQKAA